LLFAEERLVAILVQLADAGHGENRGRWIIETIFGLGHARIPDSFECAAEASAWVSEQMSAPMFQLGEQVVELR